MEQQIKKPSTNSVGNWVPREDEIILKYVYEKDKKNDNMMWGNLQEDLKGRSGKSCRERWFNHLDPKIKRTDWSVEEQWVLFILRNQQDEKWSLISKKLIGRTDNSVKNYWNSRLRKRIQNMQKAYDQHFERKKKQRMIQFLNANSSHISEDTETFAKMTVVQLESQLNEDQKFDLQNFINRHKNDYLTRILDQINIQNSDYYTNLASEYEIMLEQLQKNALNNDGDDIKMNFNLKKSQDQNEIEQEKQDDDQQQVSYIFRNPEILKMHLDILYKTVPFLDKEKILEGLPNYQEQKRIQQNEENSNLNTPEKPETVKRGPKPTVSAFDGEKTVEKEPEAIDSSATVAVKEASMDLLMKISPKTRKSSTRSAKKLDTRPQTRGQLAAQEEAKNKITPFETLKDVKSTPKKFNLARRMTKTDQNTEYQLRSAGTKRSFGRNLNHSISSEKSSSNCSDLSIANIDKAIDRNKKQKKRCSRSKVEKLFMTEKKDRHNSSHSKVTDPLLKKHQGGSENLEKALDDMLLSTSNKSKGPILRSQEKAQMEQDTQMLPPKDRKGKMKKIARKKRLEKLMESKKKNSKHQQHSDTQSDGQKFNAEDFGNSISQALIPHLNMLPQYNYMGPPGWTNNNGVIQGYQPPPYDPNYNGQYGYNQYYTPQPPHQDQKHVIHHSHVQNITQNIIIVNDPSNQSIYQMNQNGDGTPSSSVAPNRSLYSREQSGYQVTKSTAQNFDDEFIIPSQKKDKKLHGKRSSVIRAKQTPKGGDKLIGTSNFMDMTMTQMVKDREINPLYSSKLGNNLSVQKHNRLLDSTPSKRSTSVFCDHLNLINKDQVNSVSQFDADFRCSNFEDKIKKHESLDTTVQQPQGSAWQKNKVKPENLDDKLKNLSGVSVSGTPLKSIKKF